MNSWVNVKGVIKVTPLGESQAQKRYVLDTILDNMPKIESSEEDMNVYVSQVNGYDETRPYDEYGNHKNVSLQTQYILTLDGALRDTVFDTTIENVKNWLNILSERIYTSDVFVVIEDYVQSEIIYHINDKYTKRYIYPSYSRGSKDGVTKNWGEHLLWQNYTNVIDKESEGK